MIPKVSGITDTRIKIPGKFTIYNISQYQPQQNSSAVNSGIPQKANTTQYEVSGFGYFDKDKTRSFEYLARYPNLSNTIS